MTIFQNYLTDQVELQWHHVLKAPILFFAVFEVVILAIVLHNHDSKLSTALREIGGSREWMAVLFSGSIISLVGTLFRKVKLLCKYHVTSTSQFINSVTWAAAAFVILDTTDETALAIGLFVLSMINVVIAIFDEGWGNLAIKSQEKNKRG